MFYLVDRANFIVDAGDGWDESAVLAQGKATAFRASVIGRQLETCMVGDATKMFVRSALDAARLTGQTRILPYRCDTPDEHRRFEMVISPLADGQVKVEHRLIGTKPAAVRCKARRASPMVACQCSQCLRVRLIGSKTWEETDTKSLAQVAQDVCTDCASRLFDRVIPPHGGQQESANDKAANDT